MNKGASDEKEETYRVFHDLVNLSASALKKHLETEGSREVGQKKDGSGESTGHQSGNKIIEILDKKKAELTDADYDHMAKVVGYIKRHTAQRPDKVEANSPWVLSLKNWGHDPMKK